MVKYITYSIYSITCIPIQRRYIGQTNNIIRRRDEHFAALAAKSHINRGLQIAYNIYGKRAFIFDILETSIPFKEINQREKYWIEYHNSYENGFNRKPGTEISRTLPSNSNKIPLNIPARDVSPLDLSLKALADFEAMQVYGSPYFWCFVGKHLYHSEDGIVYKNSQNRMCCPACYHARRNK